MRACWLLALTLGCGQRADVGLAPPDPDAFKGCPTRECGAPCGAGGQCALDGRCGEGTADCTPPPREETDGWDDPPGSGLVFVMNELAIADPDRGFDLDDSCEDGCVDNALFQLGQLGNDRIRQALLGGESLLLLELAGLDDTELDPSVTVKVYVGLDADDPLSPANNFSIPSAETRCCEFRIDPASVAGGQAIHRFPARVARGYLRGIDRGSLPPLTTTTTAGERTLLPGLSEVRFTAFVPANGAELKDGIAGGAISPAQLAELPNPLCELLSGLCTRVIPGQTLLDFFAGTIGGPDLDRDQDGLERIELSDGLTARCLDGCGTDACVVPPLDPARPKSCTQAPQVRDAYSIGLTLSGVHATVRGIGR